MMIHNFFDFLWLFFLYSFFGWVLEVIQLAFHQKRFVNRGFINSPFCISYGIAGILITLNGHGLSIPWLFVVSSIDATVIEWIGGHAIEHYYHERWWDYSQKKWNLDGYICLPYSIFWGFLGVLTIRFGNPVFLMIYHMIPSFLGHLILFILIGILVIDIFATAIVLYDKTKDPERWLAADAWFSKISSRLEYFIISHVEHRLERAYPTRTETKETEKPAVFAAGCCFYKVFLLFFIGSLLGDIIETIFCRLKMGVWMSRSSLVFGPFSIVWGFAFAGVTILLYKYKDRSESFLFLTGTFLGGAYEYLCSVLSELVFGKVFWDYSGMPFNLNGRINLLYCFFWGIAAVIWFRKIYPLLSNLIEKLPITFGTIITWIFVLFMTVNMLISLCALIRYDQRGKHIPAKNSFEKMLDQHFDDQKMRNVYPKAKTVH